MPSWANGYGKLLGGYDCGSYVAGSYFSRREYSYADKSLRAHLLPRVVGMGWAWYGHTAYLAWQSFAGRNQLRGWQSRDGDGDGLD